MERERRVMKRIVNTVKRVEGWGILFEGPVRQTARLFLGRLLGVPKSPKPFRDWFRLKILGLSEESEKPYTSEESSGSSSCGGCSGGGGGSES